jgi:hypothetical protein
MTDSRSRLLLLILSALACAGPARIAAQAPGWRLLYSADSTGQALEGNKNAVREAVRAGLPIRVGWSVPYRLPDGRRGALEHVADASFLTIHQDEVFAQLAPIVRQRPHADSAAIQLDGSAHWVGMLDTTGRLRGVFTGTGDAQDVRLRTRWYAPRPSS